VVDRAQTDVSDWANFVRRRWRWLLVVLLLGCTVGERLLYGFAHARGDSQVLSVAHRFPLYLPTTFRTLARRFGFSERRSDATTYHNAGLVQTYPLQPLQPIAREDRLNVVWLVSESLRADMLTPEIMPNTWALSAEGARFTQHYSGGNGTRMGIFSMFYGLYGTYWEAFLKARRGPVLVDAILRADYDLRLQTSAHFTYPEFDKTVWVNVPHEVMLEDDQDLYWQRDRRNVQRAITWMTEKAAGDTPFFFFQFFESPHANYSAPVESVLRTDYLEDFNYATVDLERDIELIRNRYINAVHHLDQQLGLLFETLNRLGLYENTLIVITGDHGEEFMEAGHWGHNSSFSQEQIRVPLVILAPGLAPVVVDRMTSHLDIAPTVMHMLGVDTPPSAYALGHDLFGDTKRADTLVSAWSKSALVTQSYKIELSTTPYDLSAAPVTTTDDQPVADPQQIYAQHAARLVSLLHEMSIF